MLAYRYKIQLHDRGIGHQSGPAVIAAGGVVKVCTAGSAGKSTIQDRDGVALSNPLALTRGSAEFYTNDAEVDLFVACPNGQFVVLWDVGPDEVNEVPVDRGQMHQCMVIPFKQSDFTANIETDTGFDEPASGAALLLPYPAVKVTTLDVGETIDVGTDSGDGGDADGFLAAASINAAALVKGTILNGSNTLGALFEVQDSANAGDLTHEAVVSTGKSITITTTAGSDTGAGYIYLPYLLTGTGSPTVTPE